MASSPGGIHSTESESPSAGTCPSDEVLGEPRRRQLFRRARQQCEEGTSGRMWTPGAPVEPDGHTRTSERMFDETEVTAAATG